MHVGVFPIIGKITGQAESLPHARGGVSVTILPKRSIGVVFPMHVGVFLGQESHISVPKSLPHARGGVSIVLGFFAVRGLSSPCTWGCFPFTSFFIKYFIVFPMHVGVFPISYL